MKKYAIALIIVLLLAGIANAGPQHTRGAANMATQLAANGANCPSGQAPLGVDALGAAEGCFAVATVEADPIVKAVVGIVKSNGSALSAAGAGTDYVVPGGNVATATALAADPANCAAGQIAIGVTAAGVAECTATPSGLTSVGATTFTGALTGNASTATALAANGANCGAGQAPLGVDASGAAEGCFGVVTAEADPVVKAVVGIVKSNGSALSAASAGTDYVVPGGNVATATALAADPANCAAGQIAIGITAAGVAECTATPSGLTSVGATTFTGALTGNASTASALAANGANCSAGQSPLGVDASGAAEGCFAVASPIEGNYGLIDFVMKSATIQKVNGMAGKSCLYQANSTDTYGVCDQGPASKTSAYDVIFVKPSTEPAAGQVRRNTAPDGSHIVTESWSDLNDDLASFGWDGGASAYTASANKVCRVVKFAGTITGVSLSMNESASVVIKLYKDAFSDTAEASTDITGGAFITTSAKRGKVDSTLSGWTTSVSAGDEICAALTTNDSAKRATLIVHGKR